MHFLYLDASGQVAKYQRQKTSRHYVLAGIAAKPESWHSTKERVDKLKEQYFPNPATRPVELHCRDLHKGRGPYYGINRIALENEILDLTASLDVTIFGMVLNKEEHWKKYVQPWSPDLHMLEAMMNRFQWFLEREGGVGLVVSDEPGSNKERQDQLGAFEHYKTLGTNFKKLKNVIDTIFFTPSQTSVFLQLADFTAYAIFRKIESNDPDRYNRIKGKVDPYGLRVFP